MNKVVILRRAAMAAAGLVATVLVALGGIFAVAQTDFGRGLIARQIESAASDETMTVRVTGLEGNVFGTFGVDGIAVENTAGGALAIAGLQATWNPLSLLRGVVDIERVEIRRIADSGFFDGAETAEDEAASDGPPAIPLGVRLAALRVGEIDLGSAMFGEPMQLALNGALELDSDLDGLAVDLHLARTDGATGLADIDLDYRARPARFTLQARIDEPDGGLIGRLAGLPEKTPLSIELGGEGPPEKWTGQLTAAAGTLASARADLVVAIAGPGATVSVTGVSEFAALLPEPLRGLAGPQFALQADLAFRPGEDLTLGNLTAENGHISVEGNGRYRFDGGAIEAQIGAGIRTPSGEPLRLEGVTVKTAQVDATVSGTVERPALAATLAVREFAHEAVRIATMDGDFALALLGDESSSARASLNFGGLDTGGIVPPALLGDSVALQVDSLILDNGGIPFLGAVLTTAGGATVQVDAVREQNGALDGTYTVGLPQIGEIAADYALAVNGALNAAGTFHVGAAMEQAQASAAGTLGGIASGDGWVPAVLGQSVSFDTDIAWQDDAGLTVTRADIQTALGRLSATGRISAAFDTMSVAYSAAVDDIARLSPLAGVPLAGNIRIEGTAQGAVAAPDIEARADIAGLSVDGEPVGAIAATLDAAIRDAAATAGIRLTGQVRNRRLDGNIALTAAGDDVTVSRVDITLGRNAVTGNARIGLAGLQVNGALSARLNDLSDLPLEMLAPGLVGAANAEIALRAGRTQSIDLAVTGAGIGISADDSEPLLAREIKLALHISDAFGTPGFDGTLGAVDVRAGGGVLSRADIALDGTLADLGWTASASGEFGVPVSFAAAGDTAAVGDAVTTDVQRLDGTVGEYPFALRAPARVAWQPDALSAGPLTLAFGPGQIDLTLALQPQSVEASGRIGGLPVAIAALFIPQLDLDGSISGTMTASGSRRQPVLSVNLTADGLRPRDIPQAAFAGLTIAVDVRQGDDGLRAGLELTGPEETRVSAELQTTALLSLEPPGFGGAAGQNLSGRIEASGSLTTVERIVPLGGDRLEGAVSARANIAGTLARPELQGDLRLSGGAYEGVSTGVVVQDIEGHIEFTGSEARIVTFRASDGREGQLTGSGAVAIAGAENTEGTLELDLDRFTVLHRAEAEIVTSGTIGLSGSLAAPTLGGSLTVDSAEIRIPDRLPENVAELDVIEVNLPEGEGATPAAPADPDPSEPFSVALDLSIAFPGRSFVRGRGLESEWEGRLHVGGTSADPEVSGNLNIVRGTFAFAGKTFVVQSGTVSLGDGQSLEPEINVVAEATLPDLLARVRLEGKASEPTITVSSEPPLPQEEVLARILFGQSTGQLSAVQALQLAQTAASLSGGRGANVVDRVRKALGVDVLSIETGGEDGGGATLKAGKYINDKVYLSVSQGTEPGSQQVGVEVEVLPNVSVDIGVGGSESGNVGLNWKYDY
ncbi:MAG: translocation/assembly module TamB domain-containing protein [Alphaproteobacteria bacterium]